MLEVKTSLVNILKYTVSKRPGLIQAGPEVRSLEPFRFELKKKNLLPRKETGNYELDKICLVYHLAMTVHKG